MQENPALAAAAPFAKQPGISIAAIAAIIHAEQGAADGLLADFAFALRENGWRVRGLVQQFKGGTGKAAAVLVDLDEGACFPLFQNLGSGAASCSIDQTSMAAASVVLRRAFEEKPDLVIVNRFGALEATGDGFADEMLALMSEGIPLLTVVAEAWSFDWQCFTGGANVRLEPSRNALETWFAGLQTNRGSR